LLGREQRWRQLIGLQQAESVRRQEPIESVAARVA
jgi:hypothetical protein